MVICRNTVPALKPSFIPPPPALLHFWDGNNTLGKLIIQSGSSLTINNPDGDGNRLGEGGNAYLIVSYGSMMTVNNGLHVGYSNYANVHIRGNSTITPTVYTGTSMDVGYLTSGDLIHEGATINLSAPLYVGRFSGVVGTYMLQEKASTATPGVLTIAGPGHNFKVGVSAGSTGTFTQKENTTFTHNETTDRQFVIGDQGTGTYNMQGGTLDILGAPTILDIGRYATGTMHQTGGDISVANVVQLGYSTGGAGGNGTYNMDAGTLTAAGIIAGTGVANFNFAAGDIYLDGNVEGFDAANAFFHVTGDAGLYRETYDGIGETHLYYIPEPATIGVLCFGAMLTWARRRK